MTLSLGEAGLGSSTWREPEDDTLSRIPHVEGHQQLLPEVPGPQLSLVFAWKLGSVSESAPPASEAVMS